MAEAGGAPGDVAAVAVAQEEIDLRRRADDRLLAAPRHRGRRRRHVRDRRPGGREGAGKHPFGSGRCPAGSTLTRPCRAAPRGRRGRGTRSPSRPRRAARAPTPTPSTSRAPASFGGRLRPAPLHALAGRDGPARRRRDAAKLIAAFARRLSPAWTSSAEPPAALRHRRHAAAARLGRHALALRSAAERVHGDAGRRPGGRRRRAHRRRDLPRPAGGVRRPGEASSALGRGPGRRRGRLRRAVPGRPMRRSRPASSTCSGNWPAATATSGCRS